MPLEKYTFENKFISALTKYSTASLNETNEKFGMESPESLELKWEGCVFGGGGGVSTPPWGLQMSQL